MAARISTRVCFRSQGVSSLAGKAADMVKREIIQPYHYRYRSTMCFRNSAGMLDEVRAREPELLAHSPWRKKIPSGSAKSFGSLKLERKLKRNSKEQKGLGCQPFSLGTLQRCPVPGTLNTCVGNMAVKALGHHGKVWAQSDSRGPRSAYFTSSGWRAFSAAAVEHGVPSSRVTCSAGVCVSCNCNFWNKVLPATSWTRQPTPHSSFQTLKAIFSSDSLLRSTE